MTKFRVSSRSIENEAVKYNTDNLETEALAR
jgi:hypothetical protein